MASRFDWEKFLDRRRVEYSVSGARQVVVHCPFCGPEDQHQNMSINLEGRGWRCWRVPSSHYGRSPVRLVAALLGCSEDDARQIVYGASRPPAPARDELREKAARLRGEEVVSTARPSSLVLPAGFHPLLDDDPRAEPFVRYLTDARGYRESEVRWLAESYDLRWTTVGRFAWRLIFPIRDRWGDLLTWTARSISPSVELRYKQPPDAAVHTPAPRTLLGLDRLWSASDSRALVVCEGPLDATRISVVGAPLGVWATCLFGKNMSDEQSEIILELAEARFPRVALRLDADADATRLGMARLLPSLRLQFPQLPPGVGDPGKLTAAQALQFCLEVLDT